MDESATDRCPPEAVRVTEDRVRQMDVELGKKSEASVIQGEMHNPAVSLYTAYWRVGA